MLFARLLIVIVCLLSGLPIRSVHADTFPLIVVVRVRDMADKPVSDLVLAIVQDDKTLVEGATNAEGVAQLEFRYDPNFSVNLAIADYTFAPLPNSVGGGVFDPGPLLDLAGDGVADFLDDKTLSVALILDSATNKVGLDPDPSAKPQPLPVMPIVTVTRPPIVVSTATAAINLPTPTTRPSNTPLPPTLAPTIQLSPTLAPTATPTPTSSPVIGMVIGIGIVLMVGVVGVLALFVLRRKQA